VDAAHTFCCAFSAKRACSECGRGRACTVQAGEWSQTAPDSGCSGGACSTRLLVCVHSVQAAATDSAVKCSGSAALSVHCATRGHQQRIDRMHTLGSEEAVDAVERDPLRRASRCDDADAPRLVSGTPVALREAHESTWCLRRRLARLACLIRLLTKRRADDVPAAHPQCMAQRQRR
jgi:hypothetical protein